MNILLSLSIGLSVGDEVQCDVDIYCILGLGIGLSVGDGLRVSENENFTDTETVSLGFGYDAERDDYKVVRIVCFQEKEEEDNVGVSIDVYSVNTDSWITIKPDFKFVVFLPQSIAFVNGNPYWVAEVENGDGFMSCRFLVCFDVRRMVLKAFPMNNRNLDPSYEHVTFIDWKGSLASLVYTRDSDTRVESLYVLVFDEDDQIWRKVHTFGPIVVDEALVWECSRNEKMLCFKYGRLLMFDPVNGRVKVYENEQPLLLNRPHLYTEGLTCIKGMESEPEKEENYFLEGPSNN
ncbi:hypothetical protein CASFOL_013232 [Castilleja foliolosa]|uniref:F-box associated beta-propeller type 1 domain-containing protein n=1 Tax=Castilleja foliolosa TaxID=1961234 RepID=A0ABD3DK57_9LAMI